MERDVVSLVGNNGVIMKSYVVDTFLGRLQSRVCNIACLVGTNAINCGINNKSLYYIILKGFPRSISELFQLLGRLCHTEQQLYQDTIEIMLSLPEFMKVYFSAFNTVNKREQVRLLMELRQVTQVILTPRICLQQTFSVYYGNRNVPTVPPCVTSCPFCRKEIGRKVNKDFLIDLMESSIFDKGPVRPGTLSTNLNAHKGSVFPKSGNKANATDIHHLVLSLWVVDIISFHWRENVPEPSDRKPDDIICSFSKKKKNSNSEYHMNHCDKYYWELLPFV